MAGMDKRIPISDHFDGERFFNPGPSAPRGAGDLVRWQRERRRAEWPRRVIDPAFPPPPLTVTPGTAAVTFIGHSSFMIRLSGTVLLTDPVFSERCSPVSWAGPKRARAPGVALADLPRPDLVLLSHNHYDHMDLPSLRAIQRRHSSRFVTTLGNAGALARLGIQATELDWWQDSVVGPLRITSTPARHFASRTPWDRNRTLWGGFMIDGPDGKILFAGDSGTGPHWRDIERRIGAPDLALLPIGAYEPRWFMGPVHMNPAEAVQAHLDLGARRSIGMHFGTFQLTDEAIDAPLRELDAARIAAGLDPAVFSTHGFGETRVYELGQNVTAPE